MKPTTIFSIFLLLGIGMGLFLFTQKVKETQSGKGQGPLFRFSASGVHLVGRYNGKVQWELEAEKVEKTSTERFVHLMNIKNGVFYGWANGKLLFQANRATYDNWYKDLLLEKVRIWTKDLEISAPVLRWNGDKGKIVCEKGVEVATKRASGKGGYMEVNLKTSEVLISQGFLKAWGEGNL